MALKNVMAVIDGDVLSTPHYDGPTWEDNNVLGAKNLIPYPWEQPTDNNGITWTDNGDGTFTANGTATGGGTAIKWRDSLHNYIVPAGDYWLSGCPNGGSTDTSKYYVWISVYHANGTSTEIHADENGTKVTILDDDLYLRGGTAIYPTAGTVSNLTFKPMLRRIEDPDGTFQPYAMTNQQLTQRVGGDTGWISCSTVSGKKCNYRKIGMFVIVDVAIAGAGSEASGWYTIGTLPVGCRPLSDVYYSAFSSYSATRWANIYVGTSGSIQVYASGTTIPATHIVFITG